jgi:hypothetical protein
MSIDTRNSDVQDDVVASVATVLSIANQCARERGVNVEESLISITQQDKDVNQWRVNYGPRDFLDRRGGDLFVFVDASTKSVVRVLLGQ